MGTIVGINDCDPLRWPNSKWRNLQVTCPSTFIYETISIKKHKIIALSEALNILSHDQVEWDEHGYGERPDRVSLWEIETPESLFVFPTPKRQCLPGFVGKFC